MLPLSIEDDSMSVYPNEGLRELERSSTFQQTGRIWYGIGRLSACERRFFQLLKEGPSRIWFVENECSQARVCAYWFNLNPILYFHLI